VFLQKETSTEETGQSLPAVSGNIDLNIAEHQQWLRQTALVGPNASVCLKLVDI
jgi:hypothetical protein